ncbi:MAG: adenylate/guanylate cyclase domain-containing protein [Opitutaceae bacterium]
MAAMVAVVMFVTAATFSLIQTRIAGYFEETLREQYARQFQLYEKRESERLDAYSGEIINNTANPRLMAALLENDVSRFYYDLSQELETFHKTIDAQYGSKTAWPFFRFIHHESGYLRPPMLGEGSIGEAIDSIPGIRSPFSEDTLKQMLSPLQTGVDDELVDRTGFLFAEIGDQPILLKGFVCPVIDAFGLFLGDLVLVIPWSAQGSELENIVEVISVEGQLFDRQGLSKTTEWKGINKTIQMALNSDGRNEVMISDLPHLLFSQDLAADSGFPEAARAFLFSLEEQKLLQAEVRNVFILFTVAGLLVSLVISLLVSHGLSAPLQRLKKAAQKIGTGAFDTRVDLRSKDELGELGAAFNEMAAGLELKERYKAVLSKVADPRVADRLMRDEINLGGETVNATVLFADIRGFTSLTEGMNPQEVIGLLNEHMTALTEIVHAHGGVVDKFVGDEIMALFGVPVPSRDAIQNAYDCADQMIERCRVLNSGRERTIEIGVGIAHGEMVAGCMGSEDRLNYTVLGDRVNLAARLCSKAKAMEIAVDQNIHKTINRSNSTSERMDSPLKGFETSPPFYIVRKNQ